MPDVTAELIFVAPAAQADTAGYLRGSIVLVTTHDLQNTVGIISNSIEANELVCHGNGQQPLCNVFPVVQRFIVDICPVEIVILIEPSIRAGIGEVHRFIRLHSNKDLHQRKQTREDTFVSILFDLVTCLTNVHTATLQLNMDNGHTIDQQGEVTTSIRENSRTGLENGLLRNLIAALTCGNFFAVVNL